LSIAVIPQPPSLAGKETLQRSLIIRRDVELSNIFQKQNIPRIRDAFFCPLSPFLLLLEGGDQRVWWREACVLCFTLAALRVYRLKNKTKQQQKRKNMADGVGPWLASLNVAPAKAEAAAALLSAEDMDTVQDLLAADLTEADLEKVGVSLLLRRLIVRALSQFGQEAYGVPSPVPSSAGSGMMSTVLPKRGMGPKGGVSRGGLMSTAMPKGRGSASPKRGMGPKYGVGRGAGLGVGGELPQYGDVVATRLLKKSGQANVYAGQKAGHVGEVAIKVFRDASDWKDCKAELLAIVKIPEHPNLVAILDFFEVPLPCLVMNLIHGGDLRDYLNAHPEGVSGQAMRDIIHGIASGLAHLHKSKMVHRGNS
jgi:Protein tyrosine and serine/threonine kinase